MDSSASRRCSLIPGIELTSAGDLGRDRHTQRKVMPLEGAARRWFSFLYLLLEAVMDEDFHAVRFGSFCWIV